jgi:Fe-S-cluster containining protein
MLDHLIEQTLERSIAIDEETKAFRALTGLQCPPGCGACCQNPEVEATSLEMLPIARELWQSGELGEWMERVEAVDGKGVCVFYQPDALISGNGRCGIYAWRPSLCRLFGFAAIVNKQGEPELAACKKHKEIMPEVVERAQAAIENGLPVPHFADFSMQLSNLDPHLGRERLPINQALKMAIERVGLLMQFQHDLDSINSDELNSDP